MSTGSSENKEFSELEVHRLQKAFGKNLKKIRLEKGFSQVDLSSRMNVEKTSISRLENGRVNFTFFTVIRLAKVLEVDISHLFLFD